MFMKIAVISDIHGNFDALEAVMEDIKTQGCEKIKGCREGNRYYGLR